ncbi:MAG: PIN domain-containing protein [Dermatophilaceae bacterium]
MDTSVFVATETGRPVEDLPDFAAISVMTLEELRLGVLMARGRGDDDLADRRRVTYDRVRAAYQAIEVDERVAIACAGLRAASRRAAGPRIGPVDALIAATALVEDLPLYTQDRGFVGLPGLEVRVV